MVVVDPRVLIPPRFLLYDVALGYPVRGVNYAPVVVLVDLAVGL